MRQVIGRRIVATDDDELAARLAAARRVIVDVGTGNGRVVQHRAAAEPASLVIGLDADAAAMAEASRRAARRSERGGLQNVLFLVAAAEALPGPLAGAADAVLVLFPWGSLLRDIVGGQVALVEGLAALLRPGGELTILLSLTDRDAGLGDVPTVLDVEALEPARRAFLGCGLDPESPRPATLDEVHATGSSWARRIGAGTAGRPAWILRLHRPPQQHAR
jgi:16S rRNA (adenine(1408)-N(1))-methyltransferase